MLEVRSLIVTVVTIGVAQVSLAQPPDRKPAGSVREPRQRIARDFGAEPPDVAQAWIEPATLKGTAKLIVQFDEKERLPPRITVNLEERTTLRDDGTGGDARAGDRLYTAVVPFDAAAFDRRLKTLPTVGSERGRRGVPVFANRSREVLPLPIGDMADFRAGRRIPIPFGFFRPGNAANVDAPRSLVIVHPDVVEDSTRTFNPCTGSGASMGKWTFGYLMEQMANEPVSHVSTSDFMRRWLRRWETDQVVNDFLVKKRTAITTTIIQPWETASGGAGMPLDPAKAPFKLLAIINRIDLRTNVTYGSSDAGEARFVFGALGPNCSVLPFTVIFEYGIERSGCSAVKAWGKEWVDLANNPLGSTQYNDALEKITEEFVKADAAPTRPNGSSINQLRTNEIAIGSPWELREFRIFSTDADAGHLRLVSVKQTPDISFNNTAGLAAYVNANATAIKDQKHVVPLQFAVPPSTVGAPFVGGSAPTDSGMFWDHRSITDRQARHMFSLQTCNGCHAGETRTGFTHVSPAPFGSPAGLSQFMTGTNPDVTDPADGTPVRHFNDIERRAIDLDALVNSSCLFELIRRPLLMVH